MTVHYEKIDTVTLHHDNAVCPVTSPELIYPDDPALTIFNDFAHFPPCIISPEEGLDAAKSALKKSHSHFLLVCSDEGQIVGTLSSSILMSEMPYLLIQQNKVKFPDILVKTLMIPQDKILCIPFDAMTSMRVGHVIQIFRDNPANYALVAKKDDNRQIVCGYVSAPQISKKLGSQIKGEHTPETLAEIKKMLDSR
jgi:hypothetical protein